MDPQNKNSLVTIQQPTTTRDPVSNETHTTYTTLRTAWVGIVPNYAREKQEAGSTESSVTHTFRGHYEAWKDVEGALRIVDEGRVFNIIGVMLDFIHRQDATIKVFETDESP